MGTRDERRALSVQKLKDAREAIEAYPTLRTDFSSLGDAYDDVI